MAHAIEDAERWGFGCFDFESLGFQVVQAETSFPRGSEFFRG